LGAVEGASSKAAPALAEVAASLDNVTNSA